MSERSVITSLTTIHDWLGVSPASIVRSSCWVRGVVMASPP